MRAPGEPLWVGRKVGMRLLYGVASANRHRASSGRGLRALRRASARNLALRDGAWLGIDVGQRKSKVYNFCLIEVRRGEAAISFERGAWRPLLEDMTWPAGDAGVFEDLGRRSKLSERAERCALAILEHSDLVSRWRQLAGNPGLAAGACVDAPAGFARPGTRARETERCAVDCYPTASEKAFLAAMYRFSNERNHTPLRQRYYWKLVGQLALRFVAGASAAGTGLPELAAVTTRTADGGAVMAIRPGAGDPEPMRGHEDESTGLPLRAAPAGTVRVREGFPSDTYARVNGKKGTLAPRARALLAALVAAPWRAAGNTCCRCSSAPLAAWMSALDRRRSALVAGVARDGPITAMIKIPHDPPWADLWDAFACAFAACCEAHGCAVLLGRDPAALRAEGAIVAPSEARQDRPASHPAIGPRERARLTS